MPIDDSEIGEVCIPNISPRERRKRLISGAIMFAISLVILAALITSGASRWWRLLLFLPFAGAASGFFQWRDKT
jgi:fatty acid desaturase